MPRIQPLTCLLRPLAAPRTVTCRQHFRLSTSARLCDDKPTRPSPPTASSQIPPGAPTTPQSAARAADLAAAEAITESDSAQPPSPKPDLPSSRAAPTEKTKASSRAVPTKKTNASLQAVPTKKPSHSPSPTSRPTQITLPYHVQRSATRNLPVYTDRKRGGNLHQTIVRKISGDAAALRDELREVLGKKEDEIKVVPLTGQVVIKGHCDGEVKAFLEGRGF